MTELAALETPDLENAIAHSLEEELLILAMKISDNDWLAELFLPYW